MLRARNATNVRVERSAQCMSSRISTSGCGLAQQVQQLEQRLEQPQLAVGVIAGARRRGRRRGSGSSVASCARLPGAELRQRRVALAHQRAQRAEQRCVGQFALALLDALAAQHEQNSAEALLELVTSRVLPTPDSPPSSTSGRAGRRRRRATASSSSASSPSSPDEVAARQPSCAWAKYRRNPRLSARRCPAWSFADRRRSSTRAFWS